MTRLVRNSSQHTTLNSKTIEICHAKEPASLHMKAPKSEEINKAIHKPKKSPVTTNNT